MPPSRVLHKQQARLPPSTSGATGATRRFLPSIMPAENQYTPLRFPRPFASYGGAPLRSMYRLTAGLEITSGGWRGLFPIRYAPIAFLSRRLQKQPSKHRARAKGTTLATRHLLPSAMPVNRAATTRRASRFTGFNSRLSLRSTSSDNIPRRLRLRARAPLFRVLHSSPTRSLRLPSP
jgi:hypothetical protein